MKITHINTFDVEGGAARAAYRLHKGLISIGEDSKMLSRYKKSTDTNVFSLVTNENQHPMNLTNFRYIQTNYLDYNRTEITNTLFSFCYPAIEIAPLPIIQNTDVINLHWVASQYQSPNTIKNLLDLGKPVVWTLHDMFAFTGGCHYSAGCDKYLTDCRDCPQLKEDKYSLTEKILLDKLAVFSHPNLTVVTPSQWLADCVKKSLVFGNNRVEIIPYSLETDVFIPDDKSSGREKFNISADEIILLVGAASAREKRKGFYELIEVLKICQQNPLFAQLIKDNKIRVCCFGESIDNFQDLEIKITALGIIDSDQKLSQIYQMADIFILPSLEDNFPNTMLESMSCGTPVISFALGGMPDLIRDNITGFLAPEKDLSAMANKIIELIFNVNLRAEMTNNCRKLMVENHFLARQAQDYLNLYQELINGNQQISNVKLDSPSNENQEEILTTNFNFNVGKNFQEIKEDVIIYSVNKEILRLHDFIEYQKGDIRELYNIIHHKDLHITKTEQLLAQLNIELNGVYERLDQAQETIIQMQGKLDKTQEKLNESQAKIEGIESSKFWQLRNKWFALKAKLNIFSGSEN